MFNPAAERMFGISAAEAIGMPMHMLVPDRMRAAHVEHVMRFMGANARGPEMMSSLSIVGLRRDGSEFPIESTISKTRFDKQLQLTAVLRDVTERREAESRLAEMNRQLRTLSARLQDVREQERARIARELHDELGQQLTGLKLDLSWLTMRLQDGRQIDIGKIDEMRRMLDTSIASVRQISSDLRPLILDDLGLPEAITWQCSEVTKRTGLDISLNVGMLEEGIDASVATALFRIVQEALTNIVRHAGAERVEISLDNDADKDELLLVIKDDGRGISENVRRDGIGLLSMRERASELGGSFSIDSTEGRGVTIVVRIPRVPRGQHEERA